MIAAVVLLVAACNDKNPRAPVASNSVTSGRSISDSRPDDSRFEFSARTVFDKKRVCAEEGRRYFDRLDKMPAVGAEGWRITGPIFGYNAARDTCLCWHGWDYLDPLEGAWHHARWIDDIFANVPLAQYSVREKQGEPVNSDGMMSREEFGRKEAELLGRME